MKHMLSHVLKKSFPLSHLKNIRVVATWAARYHQIGLGWSAIEFFFSKMTLSPIKFTKKGPFLKFTKIALCPLKGWQASNHPLRGR
jgi:hypothetical protein